MPIERANKFPEMQLPPMHLFQGDLQRLHEFLAPRVENVGYKIGDLIATTPSDLPNLAEQLGQTTVTRLQVDCKLKEYSRLTVYISPWRASIDGSAKPEVIGLAVSVRELLWSRRRGWLSRFVTSQAWAAGVFSVGFGALPWIAINFTAFPLEPTWKKIVSALATLVACYGIGIALYSHLQGSRIHLYPRSQHRGLFEWSDVKGWIGHIISALGGALALYAAQRLGLPLK